MLTALSTDLSLPVDVYFDWIDACDAIAKQEAASTSTTARMPTAGQQRILAGASQRSGVASAAAGEKYTDENEDGFIDDDDVDAEADYADE